MKTNYISIFMDGNALCLMLGNPNKHKLMERPTWFITVPFYKG